MGKKACKGLAHQFRSLVDNAYVDDIMHSVDTKDQRDNLIEYSETLLNKFMFKTKGWQHNGKINKDDEQMVTPREKLAWLAISTMAETTTLDPRPPAHTQGENGVAQ